MLSSATATRHERDTTMTIRELQYAIQSAIDEVPHITDEADVAFFHGNIFAVQKLGNGKKWHRLGEVKVKDEKWLTLDDLAMVDIFSWVRAISAMSEMDRMRAEACALAGVKDSEDMCPAELEKEYTELANRYGFLFDAEGAIKCYALY